MIAIQEEIAKLVVADKELREMKEKRKIYMREYMREYSREKKRVARAKELGITYEEYVYLYVPKIYQNKQ